MDNKLSYESVAAMYAAHKYKFYDAGKFNVNLFGIRKSLDVDMFNDLIGIAYRDERSQPQLLTYAATTDPGFYWLKKEMGTINGTFILKPGYYPKCWKVGKHKGQYEALVQAAPNVFIGWRDNDKDGLLDLNGPLYTDVAGLNLHTTSHLRGSAEKVGAYSCACQVIKKTADHNQLMNIVRKSADLYGNLFSYALFSQIEDSKNKIIV